LIPWQISPSPTLL